RGRRRIGAADATADGNAINAPTTAAGAVVGATTPAELNVLAGSGGREIDDGVGEAAGIAAPGKPIAQRVGVEVGDDSGVAVADETSPGGNNVGEIIGADFDFEHA